MTPSLLGYNILNPRKLHAYAADHHGLTVTNNGDDSFTVSGTSDYTGTWSFSALWYDDYTLSGKSYAVQVWHESGDEIVADAYGFRTDTERAVAFTVTVVSGETYSETVSVSVSPEALTTFRPYEYPMITDRTRFDVQAVKDVKARLNEGTATADDTAAWTAGMKGAMSSDDWTRIYEAILDYVSAHPDTSVVASHVTAFYNNVVAAVGIIGSGITELKLITEAIYADGAANFSKVPHNFGDGITLNYQNANNIEALLAAANRPTEWHEFKNGRLTIRGAAEMRQVGTRLILG